MVAQFRTPSAVRTRAVQAVALALLTLVAGLVLLVPFSNAGAVEVTTTTTAESTTTTEAPTTTESTTTTVAPTTSESTTTTAVLQQQTGPRQVPVPTTRAPGSTTSSTSPSTSSTTSTTISRGAVAGSSSSGGGSSTGLKVAVSIIGLIAVAGGFIVLTVVYWRQTRPVAVEAASTDIA